MTGILNALFASLAGPQNVTVIQSFTATGDWVCPTGVTEVEWLIVAGGGGASALAGAGGAGGFRTGTGLSVTAGTTYTVTVGAGGPSGTDAGPYSGTNGGDSSIAGAPIAENPSGAGTNTLKAYGGGGGGYASNGLMAGLVVAVMEGLHLLVGVQEILHPPLLLKVIMGGMVRLMHQSILVGEEVGQVILGVMPQQVLPLQVTEGQEKYLIFLGYPHLMPVVEEAVHKTVEPLEQVD
jgi:hypothetical protein